MSKSEKRFTTIELVGLVVSIVSCVAAVIVIPEIRGIIGLDGDRVTPSPTPSVIVAVTDTPQQQILPTLTQAVPSVQPTVVQSPGDSSGPWTTSSGGLTLSVERIEVGGDDFRVWMTANNSTSEQLTLSVYGYFFVIDDLGNQYTADSLSSTFPRDIAPGATVSGYANVQSPLNSNASELEVTFTHVFGSLSIDSITVEGIPVP